jgi:hypothetical protein
LSKPFRRCASLFLALAAAACGPKLVRETVFENERVLVLIRHSVDHGKVVARGRAHPAVIADVRLAHILASISHEDGKGERRPTIRSEHVYELAEGMAKAFGKAGPDDEVVGVAYGRDRRLAIFTTEKVTAFRSWVEAGGELVLEFFAIEQDPPEPAAHGSAKAWEPPAELPGGRPPFKLMPGDAQRVSGARGLAIAWRDDYYRQPVSMRIRGGKVRRRTVLLEAPIESVAPAAQALLPPNLSDAQRRALDGLEAARREGLVRETEYQRRRILILEGQLEDAGYGQSPP